MSKLISCLLFLLAAVPACAQYVVDQDLGQIASGASVTITGDTSANGGTVRNAAGFHFLVTDFGGNWGRERVYQFEATEPLLLELETVESTGDPDFILLTDLETFDIPAAGKASASSARAVAFLDGPNGSTESLRGVPPGTYYLAIENFDGFDLVTGPVPQGDATFTTLLKTSVPTAYDLREIQEVIATPGGPISFSTAGSGMDTVIALYRDDNGTGTLVATNDNANGGVESELFLEDGLEEGTYLLGVGGAGTQFGENFAVTPGTTDGTFLLTHSNGLFAAPTSLPGNLDLSFPATSVQYFSFIVAEPPPATDLGQIATTDEPVFLSLLNSTTLPDSEIALYDDQGFLIETNDDFDPGNNVFLSRLDFPALPEGTYYVAVSGWDYFFLNGFVTPVLFGGTTLGSYTFDYPGGSRSGAVDTGEVVWFRFDVGAPAGEIPPLKVTSFSVATTTGAVTLTWDPQPGKTYAVYSGSSLSEFVPLVGQTNLTSGSTTFNVDLESIKKLFFQIREE